jgi:hypothetical protein
MLLRKWKRFISKTFDFVRRRNSTEMKKPIAISVGLFLFLFGLAFAKTVKTEAHKQLRIPASSSVSRAE